MGQSEAYREIGAVLPPVSREGTPELRQPSASLSAPPPPIPLDLALAMGELRVLFRAAKDADEDVELARMEAMLAALSTRSVTGDELREAGLACSLEIPHFPSAAELWTKVNAARALRRPIGPPRELPPPPVVPPSEWTCEPGEVEALNDLYAAAGSKMRYRPDGTMDPATL